MASILSPIVADNGPRADAGKRHAVFRAVSVVLQCGATPAHSLGLLAFILAGAWLPAAGQAHNGPEASRHGLPCNDLCRTWLALKPSGIADALSPPADIQATPLPVRVELRASPSERAAPGTPQLAKEGVNSKHARRPGEVREPEHTAPERTMEAHSEPAAPRHATAPARPHRLKVRSRPDFVGEATPVLVVPTGPAPKPALVHQSASSVPKSRAAPPSILPPVRPAFTPAEVGVSRRAVAIQASARTPRIPAAPRPAPTLQHADPAPVPASAALLAHAAPVPAANRTAKQVAAVAASAAPAPEADDPTTAPEPALTSAPIPNATAPSAPRPVEASTQGLKPVGDAGAAGNPEPAAVGPDPVPGVTPAPSPASDTPPSTPRAASPEAPAPIVEVEIPHSVDPAPVAAEDRLPTGTILPDGGGGVRDGRTMAEAPADTVRLAAPTSVTGPDAKTEPVIVPQLAEGDVPRPDSRPIVAEIVPPSSIGRSDLEAVNSATTRRVDDTDEDLTLSLVGIGVFAMLAYLLFSFVWERRAEY